MFQENYRGFGDISTHGDRFAGLFVGNFHSLNSNHCCSVCCEWAELDEKFKSRYGRYGTGLMYTGFKVTDG